ncbi:hypothetical protein CDD81_1311 [Ophiocordyceps australis]|uniref:Carrier domain-containing protein n=1 Tax=Ophiocordyceps australis TaxID=1399860 RepID=A0A2C5X853_9HYPO|nr:hypothetical protein CDD81_1311 [Ophiocordyceps australis]
MAVSSHATHKQNERLLPQIIDHVAQTDPEAVWMEYPRSESSYDDGFAQITYGQLARAVDKLAWYLYQSVEARGAFQTLAYIGPNDARYALIVYACIKASFKVSGALDEAVDACANGPWQVLFSSPKNSVAAHVDLFSKLDCHVLVTTKPTPAAVAGILDECQMGLVYLPSVEELLEGDGDAFPFTKTWAQAHNDPFAVLHTSGSTGMPKPVVYTHDFIARNANAMQLPAPRGYVSFGQLLQQNRSMCILPLFHAAGFCIVTCSSILLKACSIIPISACPPTEDSLLAMLEHTGADWAVVPPSIFNSLGRKAEVLEAISTKMQRIGIIGGNASSAMVDRVSRKLQVCNLYGSSECGTFGQVFPHATSHHLASYISFHSDVNALFCEHSSGAFELVVKRNESVLHNQAVFALFPHLDEFRSKDLFAPHDSLAGFWQYKGRTDDMIVFSNGEKTNPQSFESHVCGHAHVAAALVFGSNREEAGILIETTRPAQKQQMLQALWPTIEQANLATPAHARIAASHICLASPDKPMARTSKGTVKRAESLQLYKSEIDAMYSRAAPAHRSLINPNNLGQVLDELRSAYTSVTKSDAPPDEANLFTMGIDSLQALRLARELRRRSGMPALEPSIIYKNPSIAALATKIQSCLLQDSLGQACGKRQELQRTLDAYKTHIRDIMPCHDSHVGVEHPASACTILLSGTTGYIGSYLLDQLLAHPSSPSIICLNRSADAKTQALRNKEHDQTLASDFPPDRVRFLSADYAQDRLGLSEADFETLLQDVTLVVHNAWAIDFNLSLAAFRPVLDGLVNLLRFCNSARHRPVMAYTSSVSAVMNMSARPIPESLVQDVDASATGYGESKFVAEHMLHEAAQCLGLKAKVLRVTQVSGAAYSPGLWNPRDWLPRLVLSSKYLGAIPQTLGTLHIIDWLPVDVLARLITDICFETSHAQFAVYHAVNPNLTTWAELLPSVIAELEADGSNVVAVPGAEWVERLRQSAAEVDDEHAKANADAQNPALGLLEFFEHILHQDDASGRRIWSVQNSLAASNSLQETGSIRPEWMGRWVRGLMA